MVELVSAWHQLFSTIADLIRERLLLSEYSHGSPDAQVVFGSFDAINATILNSDL